MQKMNQHSTKGNAKIKLTPTKEPMSWISTLRFSPNKTTRLCYDTTSPKNEPVCSCSSTPRFLPKSQFNQTSVLTSALFACKANTEQKTKLKKDFNTLRASLGSIQKRSQNRNNNTKIDASNGNFRKSLLHPQKSTRTSSKNMQTSVVTYETLKSLNSCCPSFSRTFSRTSQTANMSTAPKITPKPKGNAKAPATENRKHKPVQCKSYSLKCLSTAANPLPSSFTHASNVVQRRPAMIRCLQTELIAGKIQEYLPYSDFFSVMLVSKQVYSQKLLHKAQLEMLVSGLDKNKRKKLWVQKCQIKPNKGSYDYYCAAPTSCDHEIDKDITRTFTHSHQFCKDHENYRKLRRILHAFAAKHPEIGYIQGLNFVVGNLILLFPEETAFWALESLCEKYKLSELWIKGMPRLKRLLYQLERLMQIYVPDVYAALLAKEVPCEVFSIQWYLTLFSHDFEPTLLAKVWDLFLLLKWEFVFQLSIAILKQMSYKIEELEYDELVVYLKSALIKGLIPTEKVLKDAVDLKISKEMLKLLAAEYESRRSDASTPTSHSESIKVNVTRLSSSKAESPTKKSSTNSLSSRYHTEVQKRRGSAFSKQENARLNTSLNSISAKAGNEKSHQSQIKRSYIAQAMGDIGSPLVAVTPKVGREKESFDGLDADHATWELLEPKCQKPLVPKKLHLGLVQKKEGEKLNANNSMAILKTVKVMLQQRTGKELGPKGMPRQPISPI